MPGIEPPRPDGGLAFSIRRQNCLARPFRPLGHRGCIRPDGHSRYGIGQDMASGKTWRQVASGHGSPVCRSIPLRLVAHDVVPDFSQSLQSAWI
ncbi:hypothetical protein [Methylobacterium aquaticum]|uniref:hypothetical protein n=1 Tax=Methylobacterium aquaticum TaxID=270351 RepID=UPI001933683A|nr:hypothetical protein [Methylobacterium aquaticum]QRE73339.1 hypothetical protein F1D61_06585 [Methylobacterium aquaticum]